MCAQHKTTVVAFIQILSVIISHYVLPLVCIFDRRPERTLNVVCVYNIVHIIKSGHVYFSSFFSFCFHDRRCCCDCHCLTSCCVSLPFTQYIYEYCFSFNTFGRVYRNIIMIEKWVNTLWCFCARIFPFINLFFFYEKMRQDHYSYFEYLTESNISDERRWSMYPRAMNTRDAMFHSCPLSMLK